MRERKGKVRTGEERRLKVRGGKEIARGTYELCYE